VVAPDGQLCLLPFEALRLDNGEYLVETTPVRYVTTGRDLLPGPEVAPAGAVAVVLSDPAYDALPGGSSKVEAVWWPAPSRALHFKSLPGFAREAAAVSKLLRGRPGWDIRPLQKERASEEALASVLRPRLVYCITHGFFLQDAGPRPATDDRLRDLELVEPDAAATRKTAVREADARLRSGLALAGANVGRERAAKGLSDGLLTALEVENLDLWGTDLVVLSACETGLGDVKVGEGVVGLRNAFQQAGARTVVASFWKVPDAQTEQLMSDFLGRWLKGGGKAEALRQAQLEMIRWLRNSDAPALRGAPPLYWAGFVCHGQDR
jgi:CHAT domain-containing protein